MIVDNGPIVLGVHFEVTTRTKGVKFLQWFGLVVGGQGSVNPRIFFME